MDDPVAEIAPIILGLTTTPPATQRQTLERYFTPNASFDHPLCVVDSFFYPIESRRVVLAIYRWYKILSPVIELKVNSIAFDEQGGRLYVDATQIFTFWFIPWKHITAELVSVLQLEKRVAPRREHPIDHPGRRGQASYADVAVNGTGEAEEERWYIKKQTDLYQTEQWVGFLPLGGLIYRFFIMCFKRVATLACIIGATVFLWLGLMASPDTEAEDFDVVQKRDRAFEIVLGAERKVMGKLGEGNSYETPSKFPAFSASFDATVAAPHTDSQKLCLSNLPLLSTLATAEAGAKAEAKAGAKAGAGAGTGAEAKAGAEAGAEAGIKIEPHNASK